MPRGRKQRSRSNGPARPRRGLAFALLAALLVTAGGLTYYAIDSSRGLSEEQYAALVERGNADRKAQAEAEAADEAARVAAAAEAKIVKINAADEPVSILFVGDSLTYGAFASTEDATYRQVMLDRLGAQTPVESDFVGGSGMTSLDVLPLLTDTAYDLVIVELGTNDATNLPEEDFAVNYRNLLTKIRAASPDAGMVCAGAWQTAYRVSQTVEEIDSLCPEFNGTAVSLGDLYLTEANRGPQGRVGFFGVGDNFHPNDAGHLAIADRILGTIRVEDAA